MGHDDDLERAAESMLARVRTFAASLDDTERSLFAALIAPCVEDAWADGSETEGFAVSWSSNRVRDHLLAAIRTTELRIQNLPAPDS